MHSKMFVGVDVCQEAYTSNKLMEEERLLITKLKNNLEKGFKNRTLSSKKLTEYNLYDKLLKSDDLYTEVTVLNRLETRLLNKNSELSALVYRLRFMCCSEDFNGEWDFEEHVKERTGRGATVPFCMFYK